MTVAVLRDYQLSAVRQLHAAVNAGRNPVYAAPTGTGKTKTAVRFIIDRAAMNERVFVIVPQVEIFNQWMIELAEAGAADDAGYINDTGVNGRGKRIYIIMPMSLVNILPRLPHEFRPDVIVTDEAHRSEAATWQAIYNYFPSARRVGLTATPERTDGQGLANTYDMIVQTTTMQDAINSGYLARPLLIVPEKYKIEIDVPESGGDYDVKRQAEILGKPRIIGDVIRQYGNIFAGHPVMVACSTFEHADIMTAEFRAAGWKFEHIHSALTAADRAGILRRIRTRQINGVCTVGIGIEGLDIPGLYGLIWLRRTLSATIYLQFIGRVLRPMPGKKYGVILDPVGNVFIHGRPEMPRTWSLEGRQGRAAEQSQVPKMKTCPMCSVMNAMENATCHICGYDFLSGTAPAKGRKLPRIVNGELVVLDDDEMVMPAPDVIMDGMPDDAPDRARTELSGAEKMRILKTGLERKSGFFADAVKKYL